MSKKILVTAALPYINSIQHLGHMVGCHFPADIFTRFHKTFGDDVVFVDTAGRLQNKAGLMEELGKIGLIVDAVKEVVALEENQIEKMKYDSKDDTTHFVTAVGKVDDTLVSSLDLNVVVLDKTAREEI